MPSGCRCTSSPAYLRGLDQLLKRKADIVHFMRQQLARKISATV